MAIRQYVGARYVPRFTGLYDATQIYDALDVVDNGSGTSYIAKKTVPAGTALTNTDYWFVYGATSGAILDLQSRMTTAEGNISTNSGDITALQGRMTSAENAIIANYNSRRKRNFIVIGDSFGAGVVEAGQPLTTGWIQAFKQMWQDNGHGKVYYNIQALPGVSGFASSLPFLTILTDDIETQISDFNEITDIVVLGGTNDQAQASADVKTAIQAFCNHCKTNFPYARVAIGVYGTNKNGLMSHVFGDYASCILYGAEFISDLFNLICDPSYISDGTHLTPTGYAFYNPYVCQAIITGNVSYRFNLGFLPDANPGPMMRFCITEKLINACFTKYNNPNLFDMALADPVPTSFNVAHYSSLPYVYLPATQPLIYGDIYIKNSANDYYNGGRCKLIMDAMTLKAEPVLYSTVTAQARALSIPPDWFQLGRTIGF